MDRKVAQALKLDGHRFGRLLVVGEGPHHRNRRRWVCKCDCGKMTLADGQNLKNGATASCGCLQLERVTRHGATQSGGPPTPEYSCWAAMKQRCLNPHMINFKYYGGRGITICDRWRDSFSAFLADMGPRPSPSHTVDRINSDGNYEPNNCRWATRREQSRSKLTVEQAIEIRRQFVLGRRISQLVRDYAVSRMVISDIVHEVTYRDTL